jgi:hypothetical protein
VILIEYKKYIKKSLFCQLKSIIDQFLNMAMVSIFPVSALTAAHPEPHER